MSKQVIKCPRVQRLGVTVRTLLQRKMPAGIVLVLIGATLVLPWTVSAHNINLDKAQELARNYARKVRTESNGKYTHYSTDCVNLFQGHNHYVRCTIEYDNDDDNDSNSRLCREAVDVFLQPHNRGETFNYFMKHYSGRCGSKTLRGASPVG